MQSTGTKIAIAIGSVAVVVVLFVALRGGDDDSSDTETTATTDSTQTRTTKPAQPNKPAVPTIRVRDNEPVGGVRKLSADKDKRVKFDVSSNIETSVHVHVYDIEKTVPAGGKTRFNFKADLEGVFEIEDHVSNEQVASLRVTP